MLRLGLYLRWLWVSDEALAYLHKGLRTLQRSKQPPWAR